MTHPHVDDAPGLQWRPRKTGWEARWRPRTDLVVRGYPASPQRLWAGTELTDVDRAWISDRCNCLQNEMLMWGRGGVPVQSTYDGSLKSLIECYTADPDSGYRKLRYHTRGTYDSLLRRLIADRGSVRLGDIRARNLKHWHEEWIADGKVSMAHSLIGMIRTLCGFGATLLEEEDEQLGGHCVRLSVVLHKMKFQMAKPRNERLTAEQATAFRAMAHQMGRPSLALCQALQFELMLRQKDVIGEWVPITAEPGASDMIDGNSKWLRGLRWEEIDHNMILRHTTSKRGKVLEVDLKLAGMVVDEIGKSGGLRGGPSPDKGPVIICERSGVPWTSYEFRRWWRKVADAAGIPKTVYNMDSRAGGITEATDAGAELEHVRHAATHSDIAMTQRYSRGSTEKVAGVMAKRAEHRNKSMTPNDPQEL